MLAVGTDGGVYRYARQGGTWELRGTGLEDAAIGCVIWDGGAADRLMASARRKGVFRSEDGGKSWRPLLQDVDAWCVAVAPDGTLYAGVEPAGVLRSRTAGEEWEELDTIKMLPTYQSWSFPQPPHIAHVRSFVFSKRDPRTIYGGVEVGGAIGTTDGGDSWRELREGIYLDVHNLAIAPGSADVLYAATGRGFFRSHNSGVSWEMACQGLHSIYMRPIALHPRDPQRLFTAAATGSPPTWNRPEGAATIIYRSANGGTDWEPIMEGLPPTLHGAVDAMAVDLEDTDTLYAGTTEGQVLVSRSLGDSWQVLAQGLPPVHTLAVV